VKSCDDFTICIKAYERPDCVVRLLASIDRHCRGARILIADDSRSSLYFDPSLQVLRLPPDVGLSAGRNALADACETEYLIFFEDDFVVAEDTRLNLLVEFVRQDMFDVAGGATRTPAGIVHFEGWLHPKPDKLHLVALEPLHYHPLQVRVCDITANFMAMKTETAQRIRWDDDLRMGEHYEFFLRCKEASPQVRVGYLPMCVIDHLRDRPGAYKHEREQKQHEGHALFLERRGYTNISGSLTP